MDEITPLQEKLADIWHIPAIVYVLFIGVFLEIGILTGVDDLVNRLSYSFLLIPVFIGLDQLGRRLLSITFESTVISLDPEEDSGEGSGEGSGEAPGKNGEVKKEDDDQGAPWGKQVEVDRFVPLIRRIYLVLMAAVSFFLLLKIWGVGWQIGVAFSRAAFSIMITGLFAYVGWVYLSAIIDRKLKEEMPDEEEEMEEGGAGGSRIGTLLLLLKKTILVTIVVMVVLIILSALGVNIGPLIAGAGIFGLAVGFGAQTLVKDILSGVFFLIDDAFRVGDYIEAGSQKGTVEQISLRALRLRHHRGPVITIPFGDLSAVKNLSRDYVIQKLKFRVPYDTDVDKVRKIVKKIYKEIRKDEEMGPSLLGKIKSQGVKELDDSAMIMRVKFKCIPGEQFLIQREVLRRMQERFKAAGLRFAHRNVTVYLPREEKEEAMGQDQAPGTAPPPPALTPDEEKREKAAAAAAALLCQEAEEKEEGK
ncbi:MAG: mechanosensitive ion channel family protein [Desulfobacterales bacterium]|nr:mechanosensitive ion channel family protein [Desulfobacterales bacterium]